MMSATSPAAFSSGIAKLATETPSSALARKGVTSIIGTTMRSWKMRMPTVARPWGESVSPRAARDLSTMAVLLRERRNPQKIACRTGTPSIDATRAVRPTTLATCSGPPTSSSPREAVRCGSENSTPIVKSSSTTPISASTWTCSMSETRFSPCGPMRAPATRKPAIEGRRSW